MRRKKYCLLSFLALICYCNLPAQDKSGYKFGKITTADFNLNAEKFDSGANAVIIADIGNTRYEGNDVGFFNIIFTRFLRVKIINKKGFDIGNQSIILYTDTGGIYEKITSLKASTFNLENGTITETKLDEKSMYKEKYGKNHEARKFSIPALKEGSIFDLMYTVKSPFPYDIKSWAFQGTYPLLWSEYDVTIPPVFHFVMKIQGDDNFDVKTTKQIPVVYSIREQSGIAQTGFTTLNSNSVNVHWVKKNVPALHEEPFTTTLKNYFSQVSFQINYFQWSNEDEKHEYMTDWKSTSKKLLAQENFGKTLNEENYWMAGELKTIVNGLNTDEEKTYRIYNYIRDKFNVSNKDESINNSALITSSLKEVFKKGEGNAAEINLLLTAMLRKAGINADPMILSTRDHGIANPGYPLIDEYNYVVCMAFLGNKSIPLDASQAYNGYGQLPLSCYNGWAQLINEERPRPFNYSSDSLHEASITRVLIFNDDSNKSKGAYKNLFNRIESNNIRREISSTSLKSFEGKIQLQIGSDIAVENIQIDSLYKYDFPIQINYDFDLKNVSSSDILYFNPMLNEGYRVNPFQAMQRHYPVEIPYQIDKTYILNMDIPVGYQVDEIPTSARVKYNENEGLFEYLIQKGVTNIQLRVHLKLNKSFFAVEEYQTLRDFFGSVVKKENENIVFKKIR